MSVSRLASACALTKELADYGDRIEREISVRRIQIEATELKLKSLAHAVADGAKLETLRGTIVELEAHKAHQEAELDSYIKASSAPR